MPRPSLCVAALLPALAFAAPTGNTRSLVTGALKGLRVWESGPQSLSRSATPGNVRRGFYVRLANETREEIAEVDVRLRIKEGGRTVYLSPTFPLRRFDNVALSLPGSLLPYNKTISNTFTVDYPARFWTTDSREDVEIVATKVYAGAQDLHNPGHFCAFLMNSPDKTILDRVRAEPALLKMHGAQNVDATFIACAVGSPDVIRYVLAHGGDLRSRTTEGTTVVHAAAFNTNPSVLPFLRSKGAPLDAPSGTGRTPLMEAIRVGNQPSTHWLLEHGANPNRVDKDDRNPMYYAITEGQTQTVEALFRAGANPRYHNRNGWGWMHTAAVHNVLILPWILRAGVAVDDADPRFGVTPLMAVAYTGSYDSIPWLIAHGANPDARDAKGRTAYDYARRSNTLRTDRFFRDMVTHAKR